jgi:hypothetical protein
MKIREKGSMIKIKNAEKEKDKNEHFKNHFSTFENSFQLGLPKLPKSF